MVESWQHLNALPLKRLLPSERLKKVNLAGTWRELGGNLAGSELTKRQYSICQLINENPNTTVQTLAESLKVSKRTIERELAKLQKAGIIRHEGKVNAGIWVILGTQKG